MNHPAAAKTFREQQAGSLRAGDHLVLPDGERSAEIHAVEVETDDFGSPAIILATLTGGGTLRIAAASAVRVPGAAADGVPSREEAVESAAVVGAAAAPGAGTANGAGTAEGARTADGAVPPSDIQPSETRPSDVQPSDAGTPLSVIGNPDAAAPQRTAPPAVVVPPLPSTTPVVIGPSADDLTLIPEPSGTPESVVEAVAEAHPDSVGVQLLADKLVKGINTKSGSCLKDLSDLAHELFVMLKDAEGSLKVADLLNVLPFDGNPGRWGSVEASLALSSYVCRQTGHKDRAAVYEKLLRAPDNQETDPFKARMQARVRQRSLNEPNLYDKEIFRSIDNSNHEAEREWRLLRLESLLFLRAHGGSQTISGSELERRIANELESVRG
jgi:hypothetical protein